MPSLAKKPDPSITIRDAANDDIATLISLGESIWNAHYPGIITQEQIDYMLAAIYNAETFAGQIAKPKCRIYIVHYNGKPVGYAEAEELKASHWHIHKFYIDTKIHKSGIGSALMAHVIEHCKPQELTLYVNRKNYGAINFYFSKGFRIDGVRDANIGNGFMMEDFTMKWQRHG